MLYSEGSESKQGIIIYWAIWCNWLTHLLCKEKFRVRVPHCPQQLSCFHNVELVVVLSFWWLEAKEITHIGKKLKWYKLQTVKQKIVGSSPIFPAKTFARSLVR